MERPAKPSPGPERGELFVASGIFLSRISGLLREKIFAHFFGNSIASGAFKAALRIPNFLQNLFGEGVLSGSFIPVYAQLLGIEDHDEADRVAGAVFGLLSLTVGILVAVGIVATAAFIDLIAPGFTGHARELTILLVRILFPAMGFLVLSAWCLGILNSHRRFFLSYAAPVSLNLVAIAALVVFGSRRGQDSLATTVAYAMVAGSLLQFGVQLPAVMGLLRKFRPSLSIGRRSVRQVLKSFGPIVISRGVVQISAFLDTAYASFISPQAVSALSYAQTIYLIPVSLFGMAVSAAELPEMSRATGDAKGIALKLKDRLDRASRRIAFFVVPSAAALLMLGDVVGGALLQGGHFRASDTRYLWYLLIGSTVGLLAATQGRLYATAFYALKDTRTPLWFASLRVAITAGLAYWSAVKLPGQLGIAPDLGAVGITATTGLAAWLELLLLKRALGRRIGPSGISVLELLKLWTCAAAGGGIGLLIKYVLVGWAGTAVSEARWWHERILPFPAVHPIWVAAWTLFPFGIFYFASTFALGVPQSRAIVGRLWARLKP